MKKEIGQKTFKSWDYCYFSNKRGEINVTLEILTCALSPTSLFLSLFLFYYRLTPPGFPGI